MRIQLIEVQSPSVAHRLEVEIKKSRNKVTCGKVPNARQCRLISSKGLTKLLPLFAQAEIEESVIFPKPISNFKVHHTRGEKRPLAKL
ncbi:hypothetical protein TNCV_3706071 [Trichonephila clavipes]|nr:hypothetical protein TNCV_3706071 [Trichonephila clavipes]